MQRIVRGRFHTARNTTAEDAEDVASDALAALLARLRFARERGTPIDDLEAYAASIASNSADRFFARRAPQRAHLRSRIRYVVSTNSEFRLARSPNGGWICGLQEQRNAEASPMQAEALRYKLATLRLPTARLSGLLKEILRHAERPLELGDLTTIAAHAMGVADGFSELQDYPDSQPHADIARRIELKDWLEALWLEVKQLPLPHRTALLLNLGSADGTTMCLLVDLAIVQFSELAEALEVTETQLAELWNRVPLADLEIAARLGLQRQQVINLRSGSRERLMRRFQNMRGNIRPSSGTERSR